MSQPDYSNMRKLVTGDIVIKCRYGKDIRRLTINQAPTFDELCLMMTRIFKLPSSENITLKYTDNENDLISLLDDNDISHAVSQSNLLKVTILDKTTGSLDSLVPGNIPDELKSQLVTLRDSLDAILRFVPEKKNDLPQQSADPKYKPLSTAELAVFLDESRPPVDGSATSNGESNSNKQTPTIKNAMYLPPGTPKQIPMKSPALQPMHQPVQYAQRPSPLNYPSYGPPQVSPSAPGTPHSGGYQPTNINKLAGPGYINARPPMQQPQQRPQGGYPVPGTPLNQHQMPMQPIQQRPPPPQQQHQQQQQPTSTPPPSQPPQGQGQAPVMQQSSQVPPPQQQQQQFQPQPPAQPTQNQGPPSAPQQQQVPQQQQQQQPFPQQQQQQQPQQVLQQSQPTQQQQPQPYYYPNGQQQQQQQIPPPQTPQQNYRPVPSPGNRF